MQTRGTARVLAATVAAGLLSASGCSSGPQAPAAVVKASEIAAEVKQYVVTQNPDPVQTICGKLFPSPPTDVVGTSVYGDVPIKVQPDVLGMSTTLSIACQFLGTDCDVSFGISPTSSGSVDPTGLTPKDGSYSDYAVGNGIEIDETVGTDTSSANGCVISILTGKSSIKYLNDAIARVSND